MPPLPPLRFKPILREYLWGGHRLGTELGKPIGSGPHYAESWEVVDHRDDQSVVLDGPLVGKTLHELVTTRGRELFGRHYPRHQFPLLLKFLDCQRTLSVQVHPNDEQAARLNPPDLGKTEAWVVLSAEPGSKIYSGLKQGVDRHTLQREVARGNCEVCLHRFEPSAGDCVLIKAGTVHAIGSGLLIAEIQQASDTTYRLFDWNRLDADGKPRPLHIEQALDVTDYNRGPVDPVTPSSTDDKQRQRLVQCDKFILDHLRLSEPCKFPDDNRFHILAVVEGAVSITSQDQNFNLPRGGTLLVPATTPEVKIAPQGRAVVLDMYLP
jgi:mannose-6-phosphate isomerase